MAGILYVITSFLLEFSRAIPGASHQCAIGFSGVIFGLIVVDTAASGAAQRSIFGLFTVPAQLYPWALLVFWQLLMPSVSFVGHLSGVVVGQLWVWGYLRPLALSRSATAWLEESCLLGPFIRMPSFIMMPGAVLPYTTYDTPGRAGGTGSRPGGSGGGRAGGFGARLTLRDLAKAVVRRCMVEKQ
ncbi:hypothetical protein GPECTOR_3g174 [Gonium pectorale]|uniref:Peptidase S54 rhomboid domain-containing protein n=1 Tax=Gonium pectorale TaxID=33097 RepID=A0A150GYV7_GONPE|nr:hypothetical protein GPECTOR_3g174 [Gonium pectorale]|eukprot:KXZ55011.1 hypothetical protein GPECTOR_3g174 [Gonium pectorale]